MEGLLILLAVGLPLTWTVLLIVLVCQNSSGFESLKNQLQNLEGQLRQQADQLKALTGSSPPDQSPEPKSAESAPLPPDQSPKPKSAESTPPPAVQAAASSPSRPAPAPNQPAPPPNLKPLPPTPLLNSHTAAGPAETGPAEPSTPAPPPLLTADRPQPEPAEPSAAQAAYLRLRHSVYEQSGSSESRLKPENSAISGTITSDSPEEIYEPNWLSKTWRAALDYLMREGHFWVAAGVLVLFLGASFLVRYTIAMGWFTPAMRLTSTFAVGLILTGVGLAVRRRRPSWALAVQGGGLGLMYLTVVGAVRVYGLVGQGPALGVMSALVMVTAVLALWQNAQLVAHLGLAAAFAAPLLVSSSQNNYVGLFSYYSLLNLGILAMCQVRPWRRLYLTGFSLSFGIFGVWLAAWYRPSMFPDSAPFLVLFYAFYVFIGLRTAAGDGLETTGDDGEKPRRRLRTDLTLTVLAPVLFLSYLAYMSERPYVLASAAGAVGLIYLALSRGLKSLPPLTARIILWQAVVCLNLGLALLLFDLDLPREALSQWTILGLIWSLEGALLNYIGSAQGKPESLIFGRLALFLALVFTVISLVTKEILPSGLLSQFFITSLVLGGALLHAAWSSLKFPPPPASSRGGDEPRVFEISAIGVWAFGLAMEGSRLTQVIDHRFALSWMLTFGSLLSLALLIIGWKVPRLLSVRPKSGASDNGGCPLLIRSAMLVLLPLATDALVALGGFLNASPSFFNPSIRPPDAFALMGWLLAFAVQALAIREACRHDTAVIWITVFGLFMTLVSGWALFYLAWGWDWPKSWLETARLAPVLMVLVWRRPGTGLFQKPGLLNGLTIMLSVLSLWKFMTLSADPAAGPGLIGYLPVFNAVDLTQAAACLAPLLALHRLAGEDFPQMRRNLFYALGILLFIWLNLALGRAVHHYAGVAYSPRALFGSNYFQAASALVWGVAGIAAMINGHRAGRRAQWLLGAALMTLDLAKIFFIDLSKVGTLARIVSFVAVGLLLILVGYFAPLPPSEELDAEGNNEAET